MYTRRIVWFDKQGRKRVTFRSMGADDGIELDAPGATTPSHPDCPGEASWNEQLQRCVSPDEGSPAASIASAVQSGVTTLKNAISTLFSGPSAPPPPVAAASAPGTQVAPAAAAAGGVGIGALPALLVVGGVAAGAYYLWKRKKRS